MASKYSIVQYVPNPIANERINIGVVAFNEEQVRVQFLTNWERVRHFGMEDVTFLKEFAQRMSQAADCGLIFPGDNPNAPYQERLNKIAQDWLNSIQWTEPRGSLADVDSLLEDIASNFLVDLNSQKPHRRDRQDAARLTTSKFRNVFQKYVKNDAKELLKTSYSVQGSRDSHKFDAVVANGQPYLAAHGVSFEVKIPEHLQKSLFWMITDVKQCQPNFPIAIMALPPKKDADNYQESQQNYQQATSTYSELGAKVLQEEDVESWVIERLEKGNLLHR
ncbi:MULTISPECIES: DUF3037 domain-containing protein [unclassified Microcoleus]|uniref:DUF3037 domain-containing protein n=1 Tax=unclassified Microcoleus TaxID=2642155 RepID=UPI001D939814|nr:MULTISPECIES: DUF3037 domain-containing protein [unclassified Microcoleus]MCC3416584.1 DUF3037 domain-containing protein [Microcoleus sp. PH2017_07_MST_O_A]MCC3430058.1 DUF3037 domain-containing protein [Microcoleus sp. PH2017_04_SCI_O_A]MCC3440606.1 DUF3037 domain-containing protein [Microcoleus sp. PH2017_03_ELD_O_A]MCC3465578.1 DUF3037 domain-containing protein [Microcoleus sp. PH2017_06_SFM_O_A]MCC3505921.1 DUF3037 domain-containing protein [Microcoleus sp. PH2017_19_SFW_U_A]MCC3508436